MGLIKRIKARRKASRERERTARNAANQQNAQAVSELQNVQAPTFSQLNQGSQIAPDQQGVNAQRSALSGMQQIAQQGFTPQDQATLAAGQRQSALQEQAQRGAVMSQARQRGMGGAGTELLGALTAQQGAANRNADVAANLGQARLQRQFEATGESANMGAGLTGQMNQIGQQNFGNQFNAMQSGFGNQETRAGALADQLNTSAQYNNNMANQEYQRRQNRIQAIMNPFRQLGQYAMGAYMSGQGGGQGGNG